MKLVGEVYQIDCHHCNHSFQAVIKPRSNCIEPKILPDDFPPDIPSLRTSVVRCPGCMATIVILGDLIFVVGDVDEFDEIEQHR